jgi:hypothetical protein
VTAGAPSKAAGVAEATTAGPAEAAARVAETTVAGAAEMIAAGVAETVMEEGSFLATVEAEEPEPWVTEALFPPYAAGAVSISTRFEGLSSGSSASRIRFLPLSPDRFVSYRVFIRKGYSVPAVTALEKLRPRGRALLVPPTVG